VRDRAALSISHNLLRDKKAAEMDHQLLGKIEDLRRRFGDRGREEPPSLTTPAINRNDLRLICFDLVSGG
jgi:hypothetical protein